VRLLKAMPEAMRIPEFRNLLEFFEHGFELTGDDRYHKFELRFSPWIRILCDWFEDPAVTWIYLIFGSQLSKTTFMMGVQLYVSRYVRGPVPCHWVLASIDEAKQFVSNRLRNFLDESARGEAVEAIKRKDWNNTYFKVYNSSVKVGWGSSKVAMRAKPSRFLFGDEIGIWTETTEYFKRRARTFHGKCKGIFATTPPEDKEHHSMRSAKAGNWYQYWVSCPHCGEYQYMSFQNLKFSEAKVGKEWDFAKLREVTRYCCEVCGREWDEEKKVDILQNGIAVCVDPDSYEPVPEKSSDTRTLQIPSTYSVFTPFWRLAFDFINAKKAGIQALRVFCTDELAECPQFEGESLRTNDLSRFIDETRERGQLGAFDLYTAGVDVHRKGELYYVVVGWKKGAMVSGHIIQYGVVGWKDARGKDNWNELLEALSFCMSKLYCVPLDASDGEVTQRVYDFANWAGTPFIALKDTVSGFQKVQIKILSVSATTKLKHRRGQRLMVVHSGMIKDDIAAAFGREPGDVGAWSFPQGTDEEFFRHLTNEHKIEERRGGRTRYVWKPKYSGAPQHWFSALVYATAAMESQRFALQARARLEQGRSRVVRPKIATEINPYDFEASIY